MPLSVSIFADRGHVRGEIRDDAEAAGCRITQLGDMGTLLDGTGAALGDVVLLDCPAAEGAQLAALARLDVRASHAGARLIVSTSVVALDDVFACMDQSAPRLLVDPSRAERMIALGEAMAQTAHGRVREMSDDDRLAFLRLTEQVAQIAQRLDRLSPSPAVLTKSLPTGPRALESAFGFDRLGAAASDPTVVDAHTRAYAGKPGLPDPRLVRQVIRQRHMRGKYLEPELFADPAWDMLLDLTAAAAERIRVSVTSLCIASGVPPTTALRWIGQMTEAGLLSRIEDVTDRRRAFIVLSERAHDAMSSYFAEVGPAVATVV